MGRDCVFGCWVKPQDERLGYAVRSLLCSVAAVTEEVDLSSDSLVDACCGDDVSGRSGGYVYATLKDHQIISPVYTVA